MGEKQKPVMNDYSEVNGDILRQNAEKYLLDFVSYLFRLNTRISTISGIRGLNSSLKTEISIVSERSAIQDPAWKQHLGDETLSQVDFSSELKKYAQKELTSFVRTFLKSLKTNGVPDENIYVPRYNELIENRMKSDFELAKITLQQFHTWTKEPVLSSLKQTNEFLDLYGVKKSGTQLLQPVEFYAENIQILFEPFKACMKMMNTYSAAMVSLIELVNYRNAHKEQFDTDENAAKQYSLERTSIESKLQNLVNVLTSEIEIFNHQMQVELNMEKLVQSSSNTYRLSLVTADVLEAAVQNSKKVCDAVGI